MSSNGSTEVARPFSSPNRTRARCCELLTMAMSWRTAVSPQKAMAKRSWPMIVFNALISELLNHENHRCAFALGHPARLPAAKPRRAGAAEDDLELAGQVSF